MVAVRFLKLRDAAEPQPRFARGLVGRHAAADVLLGRDLEVIAQLALEVGVEAAGGEQRPYARNENQQPRSTRSALRRQLQQPADHTGECAPSYRSGRRAASGRPW